MQLKQSWSRALTLVWSASSQSDRTVAAKNTRLLYADIAWFGLLFGVTGNFLIVFLARLDASPWLLSAVTSGPALINILWQLPATRIVERYLDPKRLVVQSALPQRLGFLLIALVPFFLPATWQAYAIVLITLLQGLPTAIMVVAFQTLFTELVPRERMAAVVGMRNVLLGITSTVSVMLCGVILTAASFPVGYQIIFFGGFLASLMGIWSVARLETGATQQASRRPQQAVVAPGQAPSPSLIRDRNFVRFAGASGVLYLGMFMPAPLFPLYWVDTLGLGDGWISVFATTLSLTTVVGAYGMRRFAHRWRISLILSAACYLFTLYPWLTSILEQPLLLAAVAGFGGVWGGVINVALFSALAEVCPPEHRPRYIGVYTWLMNIAVFAAPLIGAGLASVVGVQTALVIAGCLRAGASVLFFRFPFASWDQDYGLAPASALRR